MENQMQRGENCIFQLLKFVMQKVALKNIQQYT